ncbi:MAG TPA: nucleoside-diphosphate sugar epimerase/dehydratase [Holophagaceae bacterium]|nr:nucleoside-diphosphate sugar epimerase/dehydratase [Holophagaceae bacterium]
MTLTPPPTLLQRPLLRRAIKLAFDAILAAIAWQLGTRTLGHADFADRGLWIWVFLALAVNAALGLTRQHYRLIGFRDAGRLGLAFPILCLAAWGYGQFLMAPPGLGVILDAGLSTVCLWMALRAIFRVLQDPASHGFGLASGSTSLEGPSTLVVGAGKAGLMVALELGRHPGLGRVIGFIDDALEKQGILIQGIPVLGVTKLLEPIILKLGVQQVVLAIPSASGEAVRAIAERLSRTPARVKTVPGIFNLLGNQNWKPELRDISIEDLLRREPVSLDQSALKEVLEDQVLLITGAGGSIGGELARQAAHFRPARIVLLGRGENSLWETERSLLQAFPNQTLALELCDIRNEARLAQVFDRWKPSLVLHAAAHKHVPYLEIQPAEAVENNVFGTRNVIEQCLRQGVGIFVNISTDKAVNPCNVLGATKRIAECLVLDAAARAPDGVHFSSVRFGNVLGSRGSVIPIFQDQIQRGGPVTVTHPDMTRYFMTIPEASQLVLQAGLLGDTGKVYVLDMGAPVKIVDLAADMIRLSGLVMDQDVEIAFTGLRPGEKLYEELFTELETRRSCVHPKVFEGEPEPLSSVRLDEGLASLRLAVRLPEGDRQREILRLLKSLVPTYAPSRTGLGRFEKDPSGSHRIHPLKQPGKAI